jgi:hypothetical protein
MSIQSTLCIGLSSLIVIRFLQKRFYIPWQQVCIALLLGASYLLYVACIPFTSPESSSILYSLLERKISLFVFPFVWLLFERDASYRWRPQLVWFVYALVLLSIVANASILVSSFLHPHVSMNHVAYRLAFEKYTQLHPTYFGMYICFAFAILWSPQPANSLPAPWIFYVCQFVLLISLLLLSPKTALITFMILLVYYLFYLSNGSVLQKRIMAASILLVFALAYIGLPFFHERLQEITLFLGGQHHNPVTNSIDMRHQIVAIDWQLLKSHWLWGLGPANLEQHLNLLWFVSSYYAQQMLGVYNTHNEYVNQWLSFGLFGFLFFISILGIHFRKAYKNKDTLYLMLMLIVCLAFFTENILSRQHGIIFYALFTSLFFFDSENRIKKQETVDYI